MQQANERLKTPKQIRADALVAAYAGWADAQKAQFIDHQHVRLWKDREANYAGLLSALGATSETYFLQDVAKEVAEHPAFEPDGTFTVVGLTDLLLQLI